MGDIVNDMVSVGYVIDGDKFFLLIENEGIFKGFKFDFFVYC